MIPWGGKVGCLDHLDGARQHGLACPCHSWGEKKVLNLWGQPVTKIGEGSPLARCYCLHCNFELSQGTAWLFFSFWIMGVFVFTVGILRRFALKSKLKDVGPHSWCIYFVTSSSGCTGGQKQTKKPTKPIPTELPTIVIPRKSPSFLSFSFQFPSWNLG